MNLMQKNVLLNEQVIDENAILSNVYKENYKLFFTTAFDILKCKAAAEDTIQEIMCKCIEMHICRYIKDVASYIGKAVHNISINKLKHEKYKAGRLAMLAYMKTSGIDDKTLSTIERRELQQKIDNAHKKLRGLQSWVFQLVYIDELPRKQAAIILGITTQVLYNALYKANKQLRKELANAL
jgi:RNA polymerase sigma factor (sigma-70 family)